MSSQVPGEMNSGADLMRVAREFVSRVFGFPELRPGQEEILESIFAGDDVVVIMPTGGGKSLCYQVPAFVRPGLTLVISPLIALMKDQVDSLRVLDLPAAAIHSLMSLREQEETIRSLGKGIYKLLYISPERLQNPHFVRSLRQQPLAMVAVDEAHCISQWGHDFRPDYLRIGTALARLGRPQMVALTATATERVRDDIVSQLGLRAPRRFVTGFDRSNLFWEVVRVGGEKEKAKIIEARLATTTRGAIVYTGTRRKVENLVRRLRRSELEVAGYHAGMEEAERLQVQEEFMAGATNVVVATNAFGMGIDRADISFIIHHTFPGTIEAYYQEGGRAGRDGSAATCLLLYSATDRRLHEFFIEARYPPSPVVLEVYQRLRRRPEEVLWLTYGEIGRLGAEVIPELTVASCIKILEDAGVLRRLQRYDNRAELYLHRSLHDLAASVSPQARGKRSLVATLGELWSDGELAEGVQFLPEELAARTGLPLQTLRRLLAEMGASEEATYIPPFRGRGLRLLVRPAPEEIEIDFAALERRKQYELDKLDQVMAYAGGGECRRAFLLRYFGEHIRGQCSGCDICAQSKAGGAYPGGGEGDPLLAVKTLSGIARLQERFGMGVAAKMLTGSRDRLLRQFGLDRLSTYGLLADYSQGQVQSWIKELIAEGCVRQLQRQYGGRTYIVLGLSSRGRQVMAGKETVILQASPPLRAAAEPASLPPEGDDEVVFQQLRQLRATLAKKEALPAYCIFQDRTLREIARLRPGTPAELLNVMGVGEITLEKYGAQFLELLNRWR